MDHTLLAPLFSGPPGALQAAEQAQRLDHGRVHGRAAAAALLARARPLPRPPEDRGLEQGLRRRRVLRGVAGAPQRTRLLRPEPHAARRHRERPPREADLRGAVERLLSDAKKVRVDFLDPAGSMTRPVQLVQPSKFFTIST